MFAPVCPPGLPSAYVSLPDVLRARARLHPQRKVFTFLRRTLAPARELTFSDLDRRARAIAARIRRVAVPGDRIVILCPNDLHFIEAFMGCQYAGTIPVPCSPLQRFHTTDRLRRVLGSASPAAILTTTAIEERLLAQPDPLPGVTHVPHVCVDLVAEADVDPCSHTGMTDEQPAFLQFTSGSISAPKGVKVSHANILHNLAILQAAFSYTRDDRIVSWLPFFHDWGLIGGLLQPIYSGIQGVLFDPLVFVRRPMAWLEVISRYRAAVSGAPNFAYDMCSQASGPDPTGIDLQDWRFAIVGAEPIRLDTLQRFATRFAASGFKRHRFFTSYGLAEATLAVSGGVRELGASSLTLDRKSLEAGRIELASDATPDSCRTFVSCGRPLPGQDVCVVDPGTRGLRRDLEIGEVWVSGPSVAEGYWGEDLVSREVFQATPLDSTAGKTYLQTGDQGFLCEGELYITGRIKELMVVNGRNLYPDDVERIAGDAHPALRPGKGAAFSVDMDDAERYVIVYEMAFGQDCDTQSVAELIRRKLTGALGIAPGAVILVKAGVIPHTSSGKVRRQACRQMFLAQALPGGLPAIKAERGLTS